jgi:hypothetical protein
MTGSFDAGLAATITTLPGIGTVYYVSPTGSDSNLGNSSATAWQTIAKVNAAALEAGDVVLFQGGQSFSGAIVCPAGGLPGQPITFGSYGSGYATISSTTSTGFSSTSQGHITVRDLIFTGTASTNHGIQFKNAVTGANTHFSDIKVINCAVSGYGQSGIIIWSSATTGFPGYDDVLIEKCVVSGCCSVVTSNPTGLGSAGIMVLGVYGIVAKGGTSHNNVTVRQCISHDNAGTSDTNWTGGAIFLGECNNGLIEDCLGYNCGASSISTTSGGSVCIWIGDCSYTTIRGCEMHHQGSTNNVDGDGCDMDGGCTFCSVIDCYSHDNVGAGFQIYSYTDGTVTASDHCSLLNCISINDGTGTNTAGRGGICLFADATNTNIRVENCMVYQSQAGRPCVNTSESSVVTSSLSGTINGCTFIYDNASAGNHIYDDHSNHASAPTSLIFTGNRYMSRGGALSVLWNNTSYTTISAWRTAFAAQEPVTLVAS